MRSMRGMTAAGLVLLSGCIAGRQMPLEVGGKMPDLSKKSVLVMRVKVRNDNKPEQQPSLDRVYVNRRTSGSDDLTAWTSATLLTDDKEHGKDYLASMDVAPGEVRLHCLSFRRYVPLLLSATADAYLDLPVDVPPNKVIYLGAVDAVIVPRPSGSTEPRAGPIIPLIDQMAAGFSSGKWELAVADQFDTDVALMREKYPYLADVEILRAVIQLPASGGTPGPIEPAVTNPAVSTPPQDATAMQASDPGSAAQPSAEPKKTKKVKVKRKVKGGMGGSFAEMNPAWAPKEEEVEVEVEE